MTGCCGDGVLSVRWGGDEDVYCCWVEVRRVERERKREGERSRTFAFHVFSVACWACVRMYMCVHVGWEDRNLSNFFLSFLCRGPSVLVRNLHPTTTRDDLRRLFEGERVAQQMKRT